MFRGSPTKQEEVLIPLLCFNYGRFLPNCLDSIISQTYRNWKVVVRNPQSSDNTEEIMLKYVKMDSRINYVKEKGSLSVPQARNKSIMENPSYQIVAFHDVDDIMMPRRLELSVKKLRSGDIVYGNAKTFGSKAHAYNSWPYVNSDLLMLSDEIVDITVCFRRNVWKTINGFDESMRVASDYDFWLRAAKAGFKFKYIPSRLSYIRLHSRSLTSSFPYQQQLTAVRARKKHLKTKMSVKPFVFLCTLLEASVNRELFNYQLYLWRSGQV
jgi:glycosyltransferase involved in cell wall biosynthesis